SWLLANHLPDVSGKKCLDMGSGSGIQTIALLNNGAASVTCVDVNIHALAATKKIVEHVFRDATVRYVESNLFEKVDREERFDVITFNPPYVPSEEIKWMETDGGKKGRETIDRFLEQFSPFLAPKGTVFLLQTSLNGIQTTEQKLKRMKMNAKIIARKKLSFEELLVWKITRNET
ncbi:MAG: HemK2/MTQ2 family protein methyltransferase, partial [archaeon]